MDLSTRIFRLLRSLSEDQLKPFETLYDKGRDYLEEQLREWEDNFEFDREGNPKTKKKSPDRNNSNNNTQSDKRQTDRENHQTKNQTADQQFIDDLKIFDLSPPATSAQLKKARNREIKKYHPDKFQDDPEKKETAKQILQIYNLAYERLKKNPSLTG
ncbi:MAG: J domain-containing protein [Deltaproteobacteria bacterium]|nr:J domain-containing protein [Deltaproteobacteria bacterium]